LSLTLERICLALLALSVATVPLFFYTETQDQFELPKVVLMRILSSLLLGATAAYWALKPRAARRRSPLDWPLLAFSLWLLVKTVHSVSPAISWRGEYENFAGSLTQLNYALLFWLGVQFADRWARARMLALAAVWTALATSVYALLQASQRDFIGWASESYISDRFFGTLGNPNFLAGLACMAIVLKIALAWEEQERPPAGRDTWWWSRALLILVALATYLFMGKLDHLFFVGSRPGQDQAAFFIVLLWLACFAASFVLRQLGHLRTAQALGHGSDLLVLFKALANTGTRGGFLGLMAGFAFLALGWLHWRSQGGSWRKFLPRLGLSLAAVLLILGLAFLGLGSSFRERMARTLRNPGQAFETSRLQIWVPALKIWKDYPLTGTGVDTFKSVFPSYGTSRFNRYDGENVSSRMAHCEPLQILSTLGVVGLVLWTIFCGALFWSWWKRLPAAGEAGYLLMGLGAFLAAYLAQNLVSFGVSGISVPFFVAAALLFAGDPRQSEGSGQAWARGPALALGLGVAALGTWLATRVVVADRDYALCFQVHRQMQSAESLSAEDAIGMARYALQALQGQGADLPADYKTEVERWLPLLDSASRQAQEHPDQSAAVRPHLVQGASALLYALAALKMEEAVALCPGEVKYQVYLGLAYEELFKRTLPDRRDLWFARARQTYEKAIALNPQNAYYQGNLGRLLGMAAEAGAADYFPAAEEHYRAAIRIAPVTRLFYENLLLLYARYAKLKEAAVLMDSLEARDKELAPSLLSAAASTFFQWRQSAGPGWDAAAKQAAQIQALDWARRSVALAPSTFLDARDQAAFGDFAFSLAGFEMAAGHRAQAKEALAKALAWKPGDAEILKYKQQNKL
jgi:O-antigen ligase